MEIPELTPEKSLQVVASLWAAAIVGCWCNFLTVLYVGEISYYFV